jgi:uncharacterized protein YbaR (Trm112 family)
MKILECPICHGDLEWSIKKENGNRIEEGEACCKVCKFSFPIKNDIGLFLTPELSRNDLWEQGDTEMIKYFKEYPELEDKLMNSPLGILEPADQFVRAMLLEEKGRQHEARDTFKVAQKAYTLMNTLIVGINKWGIFVNL